MLKSMCNTAVNNKNCDQFFYGFRHVVTVTRKVLSKANLISVSGETFLLSGHERSSDCRVKG